MIPIGIGHNTRYINENRFIASWPKCNFVLLVFQSAGTLHERCFQPDARLRVVRLSALANGKTNHLLVLLILAPVASLEGGMGGDA